MLRFKDLYIAVVSDTANQPAKPGHQVFYDRRGTLPPTPASAACPPDSMECPPPNQHIPSSPCCDAMAASLTGGAVAFWMQIDPGTGKHLPLKDYLAQELAKGEINITETQQPQDLQSVDEIAKLEQKLNGALQELAARKAELQKKTRAAQ